MMECLLFHRDEAGTWRAETPEARRDRAEAAYEAARERGPKALERCIDHLLNRTAKWVQYDPDAPPWQAVDAGPPEDWA